MGVFLSFSVVIAVLYYLLFTPNLNLHSISLVINYKKVE